ncbi:SDR family NAD(P)-dependent oxidoreductase [Pseudarthrobacter sp. CC12]|uniref:SDR family NAD(P)-dependent oxidoreductase n=1 Tax=Pseudarthrobacter sp. CC12 TaxID=3029193 RepID=UPI0032632759
MVQRDDFDGRLFVVTGGSKGQGRAEVEKLARRGARVIAADVSEPARFDAVDVESRVVPFKLDVTSDVHWARLVEYILTDEGGTVHGLVNNAGISWRHRLLDVAVDDWSRVNDVNVLGVLRGIQALSPLMTEGGSIVNIGSTAAWSGHFPAAYTVSKWAVRGLTAVAAMELAPLGIRVNVVHPGLIETELTANIPAGFREATLDQIPLGRLGMPGDVADVVLFLLSDGARFVNGAEITVDGGQISQGGSLPILKGVEAGAQSG